MSMLQHLAERLRPVFTPFQPLAASSQPRLRAVGPGDREALARFYAGLGRTTLRRRFHCAMAGVSPKRARELSEDSLREPQRTQVLVATWGAPGQEEIVAHAGWHQDGPDRAEFALVVADGWQGRGLGRRLMTALIEGAGQRGLLWLHASVLADNPAMAGLLASLGLATRPDPEDPGLVQVEVCVPAWRICGTGGRRGPVSGRPVACPAKPVPALA